MEPNFLKTKDAITKWLIKHEIYHYKLRKNIYYGYVIDAEQDVYLGELKLKHIPVKFHGVKGNFNCDQTELESLEGCPSWVDKNFICHNNNLDSLEHGPAYVGGDYLCYSNNLTSLKHSPKEVRGYFNCADNHLTSLEHAPLEVKGFACDYNHLRNLEHCPQKVLLEFSASYNSLESLDFLPQIVGSIFNCRKNPLLGDMQDITDFKKIKAMHLEIANIKGERTLLQEHLTGTDSMGQAQTSTFKV